MTRHVHSVVVRLWHRLPVLVKRRVLRSRHWWARNRPGAHVRWGNLRRADGFSQVFGLDRGLPVDRVYIRSFLDRHAGDIHGAVMEMSRSTYADACGGGRVTSLTIVDIDETNPHATLVRDLCVAGSLPRSEFDCVIFTQTLQFLVDLPVAVDNLWDSLRPGGVLLLTVPALSPNGPIGADFWRFTPAGLARRLSELLPHDAQVDVCGFGNAIAGAASFLGLVVEDLGPEHLEHDDPGHPVVVAARVVKPLRSSGPPSPGSSTDPAPGQEARTPPER